MAAASSRDFSGIFSAVLSLSFPLSPCASESSNRQRQPHWQVRLGKSLPRSRDPTTFLSHAALLLSLRWQILKLNLGDLINWFFFSSTLTLYLILRIMHMQPSVVVPDTFPLSSSSSSVAVTNTPFPTSGSLLAVNVPPEGVSERVDSWRAHNHGPKYPSALKRVVGTWRSRPRPAPPAASRLASAAQRPKSGSPAPKEPAKQTR